MRLRRFPSPDQEASYLRKIANGLCYMRRDGVKLLFRSVIAEPNYHSWSKSQIVGGFLAMDKLDGSLARSGAALIGGATTPEGAQIDNETDHLVNNAINMAIGSREVLNGHFLYGAAFLGINAAMKQRDGYIDRVRDVARQEGLEAKSRWLGKCKQLLLGVTQTVAVSPLANPEMSPAVSRVVRPAVMASMLGTAVMSGVSALDVVQSINEQRQQPEIPALTA